MHAAAPRKCKICKADAMPSRPVCRTHYREQLSSIKAEKKRATDKGPKKRRGPSVGSKYKLEQTNREELDELFATRGPPSDYDVEKDDIDVYPDIDSDGNLLSEGYENEEASSDDDGGSRDGDYTIEDYHDDAHFVFVLMRFFAAMTFPPDNRLIVNQVAFLQVVKGEIDFPTRFQKFSPYAEKLYRRHIKRDRPSYSQTTHAWSISKGICVNPDGDMRKEFLSFAQKAGMVDLDLDDLEKLSHEAQKDLLQEALKKSRDKYLAFTQFLRLFGSPSACDPEDNLRGSATLAELLALSDDDKHALIDRYDENLGLKPLSPLRREDQQQPVITAQSSSVDASKMARLEQFDF